MKLKETHWLTDVRQITYPAFKVYRHLVNVGIIFTPVCDETRLFP